MEGEEMVKLSTFGGSKIGIWRGRMLDRVMRGGVMRKIDCSFVV